MRPAIVLFSLSILAFCSAKAWAAESVAQERPVTQEQFRRMVEAMKKLRDRMDGLEKSSSGGGSRQEETVDLSAEGGALPNSPSQKTKGNPHGGLPAFAPVFKVYFDLNLVNRPGITDLSFENYHSFLFIELTPNKDLQFAFDVNPNPRFYELDYQVTPRWQMRIGKIWIPFDDLSPHSIFGGRVNTSRLSPTTGTPITFLPDIWTDLGIGAKYRLIDSSALELDAHFYVVNGFGSGGTDPTGASTAYPSFSDLSILRLDNNRNKALGGRLYGLISQTFGLGVSYYTGRWTDQDATPEYLGIYGVDGKVRLRKTEFRAGVASMSVGMPVGAGFKRGGYYTEIGQSFGGDHQWKFLARMGSLQLDDRVIDVTDQNIVGGTLLWKPGMIEYSVHHSRDLKEVPGKVNHTYSVVRVIIAL